MARAAVPSALCPPMRVLRPETLGQGLSVAAFSIPKYVVLTGMVW